MNLTTLKYRLIRKLFNFPKFRSPHRGFIIIQIDGLSYETFEFALKKNYLPKIKKIIEKTHNYKQFLSGIPSNTPYFQKVLFYGDIEKYPGFRWYNKREKKYYSFKIPETAEIEEKRIKEKNITGILKNGASYYNLFSGDASRTYLTLSKIFTSNLTSKISAVKLLILTLLNIPVVFKVLYWSIIEFFNEIFDAFLYKINNLPQRDFKFYPFLRIFNNVIINEYITQGAMVELICGTPKIYVTYNAYDEASHQRGVLAKSSLNILKLIDNSIWKIYKLSKKRKIIRKYDFFILSDHGQKSAIPFNFIFKKDFEDIIKKYSEKISIPGEKREIQVLPVLEKIKNLSEKRKIPKFIKYLFPELKERYIIDTKNLEGKIKIVNFCSCSQIYFTDFKKKLTFEEINENFPLIILDILSHKSVKFLTVIDKNKNVIFLGKKGFIKVKELEIIESSGEKPVEEKYIKDLSEITLCENSGDINVYANIINGKIVNFEGQLSSHGTFYYEETSSFLIYPEFKDNLIKNVNSIIDLHLFFKNNYI